ncbi:hypothetical protein [Microbulbifer sp. SAOS-129_SWC]|uniref:hypothetical protein n=1 Tax=Microbulbifer sp. SAOS-129_SWC TaxID=3145235 RepID=UPI00321700DD
MIKRFLMPGLALAISAGLSAAEKGSQYALYEYTMTGPLATVRIVQLVDVDGDREACQYTLAGIKHGHAQSLANNGAAKNVTYGREGCMNDVPSEFSPVLEKKNIADAYYVVRTLDLKNASMDYFDIFYGLDTSRPMEVCKTLMKQFTANRKFKSYRCVGPKAELRNTSTTTTIHVGSDGVVHKEVKSN